MLNVNTVNTKDFSKYTGCSWLQISVVAAEQFWEGCSNESAVTIDDQLQHILIHLHHHRRHLIIGHEEDDGEDGDLKLWTDTNEGAPDRLHQAFPTELQV